MRRFAASGYGIILCSKVLKIIAMQQNWAIFQIYFFESYD
jgi:hypothetical protein